MGELHNSVENIFRKQLINKGYVEARNPMPTYRPDIFAKKYSKGRKILEIVVEVEIESTIFSEHTSSQLLMMDQYIKHQKKRKIKVLGYLCVPKSKSAFSMGKSCLSSLFPLGTEIKVLQK